MKNKTAIGNILDQINLSTKPLNTAAVEKDSDFNTSANVILLNPSKIINWKYHDRPKSELGDINELANSIKNLGQQQPCIVRKTEKSEEYELIAGERRWRASKILKQNLKVIVASLTDTEAALVQAAENNNRLNLSDFAKGMSYAKLIETGILKQNDLLEKLGKTKQQVSSLLSYAKIPKEINNAIKDYSLVSPRTAETIKQLASYGKDYINSIIDIADKIRSGKIGHTNLRNYINKLLHPKKVEKTIFHKHNKFGNLLFTITKSDSSININLKKHLIDQIRHNPSIYDILTHEFTNIIDKVLNNNKSPPGRT